LTCVIALLGPRLDASPGPSPAVANLWGLRARAHAMLGEATEFQRSVECARESLARSRAELIGSGILYFAPANLAFYEATAAVKLGRPVIAIGAADRALSLFDPVEEIDLTLSRLNRAAALAQLGEVDEACRVATGALLDLRTYHGLQCGRSLAGSTTTSGGSRRRRRANGVRSAPRSTAGRTARRS
jgi:hypothetical protein